VKSEQEIKDMLSKVETVYDEDNDASTPVEGAFGALCWVMGLRDDFEIEQYFE
jgi:hypothetical protein